MQASRPPKYFHQIFELGVLLKGLNGALEILGGILLLLVSPSAINKTVVYLTQGELAEDPRDLVANALFHLSQDLSASTKLFGALYLLSHGLIKVGLVVGLLRRKLWAYPASIVVLIAFILYQLYRIELRYSVGMVLLTAMDAVIVVLVWREYGYVKQLPRKIRGGIH